MAPPQKYQDRFTTAVNMERKLHDIAKRLGIEFSDALTAGLHFYIRMRIADNDKRLSAELIQDFKDLEFKNVRELETYIRIRNQEQETLDTVIESRKPEETIEVWDREDEEYIHIPVSQYQANPQEYIVRKSAVRAK